VRTETEQFTAGQTEQNQTASDLKVRYRNPKCCENNFPEKNKADRHAKGGEDS
jgi:hypothetical protein